MSGGRIGRIFLLAVFIGGVTATTACGAGGWRRQIKERRAERQERQEPSESRSATPAGMRWEDVSVGGDRREYLLFVPNSYVDGRPTPLVMAFHGGGGAADKFVNVTGFADLAAREGFIVAFPNGTPQGRRGGRTWNTGSGKGMGKAEEMNVNDLGFVRAMLSDLRSDYSIDSRRIYATGLSKGGMFSYYLACNMAGDIAAIAPVAATMVNARCEPTEPVAVMHVHGTADGNVPLSGGVGSDAGTGYSYPAVSRAIDFWKSRDRCVGEERSSRASPDTTCTSYSSCAREVTLCLIRGGGHSWPGAAPNKRQQRQGVYVSQSFDATAEVWRFFEDHPKP